MRFAVTGFLNTAVDFVVFGVVSYLGAGTYLAQTLGYSAGILNSYCINRSWTFQSKSRFFSAQMLRFVLTNLTLLLVSLGVIGLLHGRFGVHKMIAKVFATGVTLVLGFLVNRLWVFKAKQD